MGTAIGQSSSAKPELASVVSCGGRFAISQVRMPVQPKHATLLTHSKQFALAPLHCCAMQSGAQWLQARQMPVSRLQRTYVSLGLQLHVTGKS